MNFFDHYPSNKDAVPAMGYLSPRYIIVGRAPGEHQDKPIGYRSVMLLKDYFKNDIYFTNLIKIPWSQKKRLNKKLLEEYVPILIAELREVITPGAKILTIGTEPAQVLCPGFSSLREDHGTLFTNPDLDCKVVPTFHFSQGAYDPEKRRFIDNDLKRFFTSDQLLPAGNYQILPGPDQLKFHSEKIFVDLETTGLDPFTDSITAIGFLDYNDDKVQIIQGPLTHEDHKVIFSALQNHILIGHNLQFDLSFLQAESKLPWYATKVEDTMIMAAIVGESSLSLKHLIAQYTNRPGSHSEGGFEDPGYLAEDVLGTEAVYHHFKKYTKDLYISELLNNLIPYFVKMREFGVYIDWELHQELVKQYVEEIQRAYEQIGTVALDSALEIYRKKNPKRKELPAEKKTLDGYRQKILELNWNSPKQVGPLLQKLGVPLHIKTATGGYSVSEPVLREFQGKYPLVDALLKHRDLTKEATFLTSYTEFGKLDGYLHPRLSLTGTTTGRLSCSEPNLQQVPRVGPIKLLFRSRYPNGYIGLIDLAQAELRVAALLSSDDLFVEALLGEDVHRFIASKIYQIPEEEVTPFQRKKSKGVTFGLLYGGSPEGLAERVGVEVSEVKKIVKDFFGLFPKLKEYIDDQKELAVQVGRSSTVFGRQRNLSTILEMEGPHSAERKAINTPIQGTASDIMLVILNYVFEEILKNDLVSFPIFGVHDSSLHDVHPDEIETYASIVDSGFKELNNTPLNQLPLWGTLPITGEFILGGTWASVESTNEEFYHPEFEYPCSNIP